MQVFNYHPIYRQPLKGALRPLTLADLNEVWQLDLRCFLDGEAYERETFRYLLSNPQTVARQIRAELGEMLAFAIAVVDETGGGHLTTIAVAPEFRRRGLARMLMHEVERSFVARGILSVRLEVRVNNQTAQQLYEQIGYVVVQRMNKYYSNGDDGYMMIKVLNELD
jgi:[ribosomal protein S18]-alanine N-acetyltransferase